MNEKFIKNEKVIIFSLIILGITVLLFLKTGFLQIGQIDERDMEAWDYSSDGLIIGTERFEIEGNQETCWLLIHGYASSPAEMKPLAETINSEFGDFVRAVRLQGHGETPSQLLKLTLDNWYLQVSNEFDELKNDCDAINIAGFSFGGALATKLSEERNVQRTYLIAPYLFASYRKAYIFPLETYLRFFPDSFGYIKKKQIAQINDPLGRETYIAYWNFPILPVKYSRTFLENVKINLEKIENPILIQHSVNDRTANHEGSQMIYDLVSSEDKAYITLLDSNHVLLADYDKGEVIRRIIDFEETRR